MSGLIPHWRIDKESYCTSLQLENLHRALTQWYFAWFLSWNTSSSNILDLYFKWAALLTIEHSQNIIHLKSTLKYSVNYFHPHKERWYSWYTHFLVEKLRRRLPSCHTTTQKLNHLFVSCPETQYYSVNHGWEFYSVVLITASEVLS